MGLLTKLCIWHIRHATVEEVDEILSHTFRRREELFPDHDPIYLALPKYDPEERKRQLERVCDLVGQMYEKDVPENFGNDEQSDPHKGIQLTEMERKRLKSTKLVL